MNMLLMLVIIVDGVRRATLPKQALNLHKNNKKKKKTKRKG